MDLTDQLPAWVRGTRRLTDGWEPVDHDSDFNLSRHGVLQREASFPNSLTKAMVESEDWSLGVSNYYLLVYPPDEAATTPALVLWFFDSRGG